MHKSDSVYLKHILDSITQIEKYTQDLDVEDLIGNRLVQDAVIRQLEIIGEATKNLSDDFKNKKLAIPWKDIAGMRDKLIHGYFGVDLESVWLTVSEDIPNLKAFIQSIDLTED